VKVNNFRNGALGLDHFDLPLGSKQGQPSLQKGDPRKSMGQPGGPYGGSVMRDNYFVDPFSTCDH
jgi:hypothetical protein